MLPQLPLIPWPQLEHAFDFPDYTYPDMARIFAGMAESMRLRSSQGACACIWAITSLRLHVDHKELLTITRLGSQPEVRQSESA